MVIGIFMTEILLIKVEMGYGKFNLSFNRILASLYITLENNMLFKTGNTTFRANLKI